jgi:putative DNA methylase
LRLVPDTKNKRYDIEIVPNIPEGEISEYENGTVGSDGRGRDTYLKHTLGGVEYKTKISTLRGDHLDSDGERRNNLRLWSKSDITPNMEDIFQERLYAILWTRIAGDGRLGECEFRSITSGDLERERLVFDFVKKNLPEWQEQGLVPDMKIEPGSKTDEPIRTRGWTYWHHLFNPRQLLMFALCKQAIRGTKYEAALTVMFAKALDWNSRISRWNPRWDKTENVFYNQAINPLWNYGTRSFLFLSETLTAETKTFPIETKNSVICANASDFDAEADILITDPPYGDAVKYSSLLG